MHPSVIALLVLAAVVVVYAIVSGVVVRHRISLGKAVADAAVPYEQAPKSPNARILVAGDSTAVGTGAATPEESVTGLVARHALQSDIVNIGINGLRAAGLVQELEQVDEQFDLAILHIGGNDVVRFTPLDELEVSVRRSLQLANERADSVVWLSSGNVGTAPFFPWPTGYVWTHRTRQVRELFLRLAEEEQVIYVDLFTERADDPFLADVDRYYLSDRFHPSSDGYALWFAKLQMRLEQDGHTIESLLPTN